MMSKFGKGSLVEEEDAKTPGYLQHLLRNPGSVTRKMVCDVIREIPLTKESLELYRHLLEKPEELEAIENKLTPGQIIGVILDQVFGEKADLWRLLNHRQRALLVATALGAIKEGYGSRQATERACRIAVRMVNPHSHDSQGDWDRSPLASIHADLDWRLVGETLIRRGQFQLIIDSVFEPAVRAMAGMLWVYLVIKPSKKPLVSEVITVLEAVRDKKKLHALSAFLAILGAESFGQNCQTCEVAKVYEFLTSTDFQDVIDQLEMLYPPPKEPVVAG